jgi:hypothetical protein
MTQTIRVERLLRESVQTPYSDLVTRSTGRAVRTSIQQALVAEGAELAMLDFSDVGLVDLSCADEIIAKLLLNPPGETDLVLQGLREEQLDAIEHVLAHHQIAVLVCDTPDGATRPVGRMTPDLLTAFLTLQNEGPGTADALARWTGWTVARTSEALDTLARLRLVRADSGRYAVPQHAA